MRVSAWCLAIAACAAEPRRAPEPVAPPQSVEQRQPVDADGGVVDGAPPPVDASVVDPLAELRARSLDAAAAVIEGRERQRAAKMKLSPAEARAAAASVLALADRPPMRALHAVMPKSLVELSRAVAERGVPVDEADAIAVYLVRVVEALRFERLAAFDENHSHVTGRDWHEIDYRGEGLTWQGQRDHWAPRGVTDYKRARHIHAYFVGAERLPHWARVYRPRGRMAAVVPPD